MNQTRLALGLLTATAVAGGLTMWFLSLWLLWIFIVLMCITAVVAW